MPAETKLMLCEKGTVLSPEELVERLNASLDHHEPNTAAGKHEGTSPTDGLLESPIELKHGLFGSFLSASKKHLFVFYCRGERRTALQYFFGSPSAVPSPHKPELSAAGCTITKCEERAMTLSELRVVRDMILSTCVERGWTSTYNDVVLRPETVSLYGTCKQLGSAILRACC